MRSDVVRQAKRYGYRGYSKERIAILMNMTLAQVEYALSDHRTNEQAEKHGSPDEIVDGERMADRIRRLTSEIRSGKLVIRKVS